jgi:hypothetical protein
MSALALEARESSGAEISGIYRNGDMVMGRNVNLTLDVVRGHGTAGIRPIGGSAGYVNRGALQ